MLRVNGKLEMTCDSCADMLYFMGKLKRLARFDIDNVDVHIYEVAYGVTIDECKALTKKKRKPI
jgi:hypothetical protein